MVRHKTDETLKMGSGTPNSMQQEIFLTAAENAGLIRVSDSVLLF